MKDLFVLAADADIEATMRDLLNRRRPALGIRDIKFTMIRHMHRDPGCRREAAKVASSYINDHECALVLFDKDGSGDEGTERQLIQNAVEEDLRRSGWENRSKAIVIEPELETWVWSASANVGKVLGWNEGTVELRKWLGEQGLWPDDNAKPPNPKSALERAMKRKNLSPNALTFKALAERVSLQNCQDPAFLEVRETLQGWFPAASGGS
ncbi:MAG: hypothetical protein F4X97_15910 [Boseongicola sp. SB0662_bin_57]|nr:hypothetical protein [Boseongicola sp. SB0662_bin_57]